MSNNSEILKSFEFINTYAPKFCSHRSFPKNIVRVHNKQGYKAVYLSADLSRELLEDDINSLRIASNSITGELAFVFDRSGVGHTIRKKKPSDNHSAIVVSAKHLVETLIKFFGYPEGTDYIELELSDNNSVRPDVKFYTVSPIKP